MAEGWEKAIEKQPGILPRRDFHLSESLLGFPLVFEIRKIISCTARLIHSPLETRFC
jgi:hypothetical protein